MGTEAFWVPAVLAAVSTGAQYVNQSQAASRENNSELQSIQNQEKLNQKANGEVNALTQQVATNTPSQIQNQATGNYVSQLRKNAAGSTQGGSTTGGATNYGASTSALAPAAVGSSRYSADKSSSQQQVQDYGNQTANQMGAIDAAVRQRQNEGLGAQTLATGLNGLGEQSYTQNFVDQLRSQVAGQANPFVSLFTGMLGAGAKNFKGAGASGAQTNPYLMPSGQYNFGGDPLDAGSGLSDATTGLA